MEKSQSVKFSDSVHSWFSRRLSTLQQKIEVVSVFGLSRVHYVASNQKSIVKKFVSLIGKFLWKVAIEYLWMNSKIRILGVDLLSPNFN